MIYGFISISCSYITEVKGIDDISKKKLVKVKVLELKTKSGKYIKFARPRWGLVYGNKVLGEGIDEKGSKALFRISLSDIKYMRFKEGSPIFSFLAGILVAGGVAIALFIGLILISDDEP